jgi:DNA-binding SARP family transcriptional activator
MTEGIAVTNSRHKGRPHAEVTLLGGFRLACGGRDVEIPMEGQRLVATLALRGRLCRSRLAGTLRPDTPEQRAQASLRTGIWRVNQVAPDLVVAHNGQVCLDARTRVDVTDLVRRSVAVMGGGEIDCTALCSGALGGELLPDWDDPWVEGERERLRQLRLHMLEAVADRLTVTGQFGLAIEVAFRVLQADSLRESAHRALIRAHLAEGNIAEARRAYSVCEQLLHRELGVSPTKAMSGLLAGIPGSDAVVTGM